MATKKVGAWALGLAFLRATTAQADGPHNLNFGDWGGTGLGKLRAKSVADRPVLPECTAFLSGPRQITTAGHCGEFGTDSLEFVLHYKNGSGAKTMRVSSVFTTGGGFGKLEERHGRDWMHILLEDDAPATGANNSKVKPFLLSNNADETETGAKAFVVSYRSDVEKGEVPTWQQCAITDPPDSTKDGFCDVVGKDKEGKKLYACNFFNLDCPPAKDGLDSGAPVFGESGKVIGILAARSTIDKQLVAWIVTANESRKAASNPYFHWLNLQRYAEIDRLIEAKRFVVGDFEAKDEGLDKYTALLAEWPKLSVAKRFAEIQQWDTVGGQEALASLNQSVAKQVQDGNKVFTLALGKGQTLVARKNVAFGQYYQAGVPVSHDTMVAYQKTALTNEIARVALLEKVKKDAEALAKAERDRDKKNFETLATNTQRRAKRVLADWINLAGADAIGIEFYKKQVAEITRVDTNADSYTKEQLKEKVAWLEKRNDWMKEVEAEQESFASKKTAQRKYEQPAAERANAAKALTDAEMREWRETARRVEENYRRSTGTSATPSNRVVQPNDPEWIEARRRVEENYRRAVEENSRRVTEAPARPVTPSYYTPPAYQAPAYRPVASPPPAAPTNRVVMPTDKEWIDARNAVLENLRRAQQNR